MDKQTRKIYKEIDRQENRAYMQFFVSGLVLTAFCVGLSIGVSLENKEKMVAISFAAIALFIIYNFICGRIK